LRGRSYSDTGKGQKSNRNPEGGLAYKMTFHYYLHQSLLA